MANICLTEYHFAGNQEDLKKLHSKIEEAILLAKNNNNNNSEFWHVLDIHGGVDTSKDCRGQILYLELKKDSLYFTTETPWTEKNDVWDYILTCYKNIKMYYCAEEPGNEYYVCNDTNNVFFDYKYNITTEYETDTVSCDEDLFSYVANYMELGEVFKSKEELDKAIHKYNEDNEEEESYIYYSEYSYE